MSKLKKNCIHVLENQKWVHYSKTTNEVQSFHYKSVCIKCGVSKYLPRTKELYEELRNQDWHSKYKRT